MKWRRSSPIRISTVRVAPAGSPPRPSVWGRGRAAVFEAAEEPEPLPPQAPTTRSANRNDFRRMGSLS